MGPVEVLLCYPLFALLGRPRVELLVQQGQFESFQLGQAILEQGTEGRSLYVLSRGLVRMSRTTPQGQERSLGKLSRDSVFGEYALLPPHENTATCRAAATSKTFTIPLTAVKAAIDAVPNVSLDLKNWLRLHALVHHFRHSAGCGFITAPSLITLLDQCQHLSVPEFQALPSAGWLYIESGEVSLYSEHDDALRSPGAGDCLGEQALFGRADLPLAVARIPTTCWYLHRDACRWADQIAVPLDDQTLRTVMPRLRRSWEWHPQRSTADCGIAALTMALRGHGIAASFESVANSTHPEPAGISIAQLVGIAQRLGATAAAVRLDVEQLRYAMLPAVVHLATGHYVSVFEFRGQKFVIGDPAEGIRELSLDELRMDWSGHAILLSLQH